MGHFFIAYSRRDFYFAESLFYALHSKGIDAWMDVWKITPGDEWDQDITDAIQSCQGFILIASKESLRSPFVRDEICRAHQAGKPLYLVIRGKFSKHDLLIAHEYPKGTTTRIDLSNPLYVKAIVDMRAGFPGRVERIAAAITTNAVYREKLPGIFGFKMEKILYIPPMITFLALFMVVTEVWKFGVGILYGGSLDQIMGYVRDILHEAIGERLLLVPAILLPETIGSVVSIGALISIIIFCFNFSRRKRVGVNQFVLLVLCSLLIGGITLGRDLYAVYQEAVYFFGPVAVYLQQGESMPGLDKTLIFLLLVHGILLLLIITLGLVFRIWFRRAKDGRGAVLRWLPTGYATEKIRFEGNAAWIQNLPDINVSPGPSYQSYRIVTSLADISTAKEIKSLLEHKGYIVTENPMEAECDLIILSPFAKDTLLKKEYKADHPKPVIYVLARSMKPQKDASIAIQWIDYRRPAGEQFWKQWERRFSQLKSTHPVFPYVPETLGDSLVPRKYGWGIWLTMIALAVGSVLLISGMEYLVLVKNAPPSLLLSISIVSLLASAGLGYYTIAQIIRGVISSTQARGWLLIAGIVTIIAAFMSQSPLLIVGGLGVILLNIVMAKIAWSALRPWLPPKSRTSNKKSLLQPISNYKAFTSTAYYRIMIVGFLGLNAIITAFGIVPYVPQQLASQPYAVSAPGPYALAAPGLWSQDTFADAFGYHFAYYPDKLEVSQDQVTAYVTWLKFLGVNSSPMRFAQHFRTSIHIHFTNDDNRTSFGLVLNDFAKVYPGDIVGPHLVLLSSGVWVIESNGKMYAGPIATSDLL